MYNRKGSNADSAAATHCNFLEGVSTLRNDCMDHQGLAKFHTSWCAKRYEHDHSLCSFAHVEINRGWLRRDPYLLRYRPILCPSVIPLYKTEDCFLNTCPHGVNCDYAHSFEEVLYHPENYKRNTCKSNNNICPLRDICPYIHPGKSYGSVDVAGQHYNRQAKRHHPTPKKLSSNNPGQSVGFTKRPEGSPMLYIDPAPVSAFEATLLLPGLRAIFRDYSSAIHNRIQNDEEAREYGIFGYKFVPQSVKHKAMLAPIGKAEEL